ncbi:MAG TPA: OmpA family protein [Vicinamibacterales bacterium]|jgi:outer membrane protein OmpA-like peptidoglycan-associated protein
MANTRFVVALAGALLVGLTATSSAQQADAANCKDHPMFSRMKNFVINECKTAFDEQEVYLAEGSKTVEGRKTGISYSLVEGTQMPSPLQIRRNYGNAAKTLGGTVLYDQDRHLTARVVTKAGKEVWLRVEAFNEGRDYTVDVIEVEAMTQEVAASDMLDALNKNGFIALYINFDTGKADIKPESQATIAQIVTLLKDNPALRVSVEGHTDNVGTAAGNKTLSEQRAKSVVAAVVKGGIAAGRLGAVGWGQEKPVADNRSEEGRGKNRRVEIVKK